MLQVVLVESFQNLNSIIGVEFLQSIQSSFIQFSMRQFTWKMQAGNIYIKLKLTKQSKTEQRHYNHIL